MMKKSNIKMLSIYSKEKCILNLLILNNSIIINISFNFSFPFPKIWRFETELLRFSWSV